VCKTWINTLAKHFEIPFQPHKFNREMASKEFTDVHNLKKTTFKAYKGKI
jgi:hypothetical protein